jgi:hypothetical protein
MIALNPNPGFPVNDRYLWRIGILKLIVPVNFHKVIAGLTNSPAILSSTLPSDDFGRTGKMDNTSFAIAKGKYR